MSTFGNLYPTLRASAGYNDEAVKNAFPFLCDLPAMAKAIDDSGILNDSRKNAQSYDKWEMALAVAQYLDTHLDYGNQTKIPRSIQYTLDTGYILSQAEFWQNLGDGIATVEEDPGYGAVSGTITDSGTFGHYSANQIASASNTPAPTGDYYSDPQKASIQGNIATSSFIDYVDTGLTSGFQPNIDTANTGITSDDIVGLSYQLEGLKGRDRGNNLMDLTDWHYPIGVPGASHIYAGRKTDFLSTFDVITDYYVSSPEIEAQTDSGGYEGTPTLTQYTASAYTAPWVHFDKDAGFTNKQTSMSGGVDDVEPAWKFVLMPYIWPNTYTYPVWERTRNTYVPFDIFSMTDSAGNVIPANATLTGIDIPNTPSSRVNTNTDIDINPATTHPGTTETATNWHPIGTNSGRLVFYINGTTNQLETKARTTNDFDFYGIPYYYLTVYYTVPGIVDEQSGTYAIPFHYLTTWDLVGTWDGSGYRGVTAGVSLANTQSNGGETQGVTGNCTADYVDAFGTTQTSTAYVTCYALDSVSVVDSGKGYALSQDPLEVIFDYPAGRYYQNPLGGKSLPTSSNNNPYVSPNGNKNVDSQAIAEATLGRLQRPVTEIIRSDRYMGVNSYDYKIRGFLGTDFGYEKDEFAVRYTLNGSSLVTGLDYTDHTYTATLGIDAAPAFYYDPRTYHDEQNPHGDSTSYMNNTWDNGEADERWTAKNKASFNVLITDGKVTGFTPRYRDDGDGTSVRGGWNYNTNSDYTELTFIRDYSVSTPADYIPPSVYYRVTSGVPADNGQGLKAYMDSITEPTIEFFPGRNVPDGAFLYAFAYGSGDQAFVEEPDENYDLTSVYQRQWGGNGFPQPSSVRTSIERPVLTSTTRSLKTINVGTGAHRYTFELEYPPLTQNEASEIIEKFDRYKATQEEIALNIPAKAMKHLGYYTYYTNNGKRMSKKPEIINGGLLGSSEIVVDGHADNGSPIPEGTFFTIQGGKKLYKIVGNGSVDQYGRAEYKIEPPLTEGKSNQYLDTDRNNKDLADWMTVRAFLMDDQIEYTVDAAGYYRFSAIKFRESL